ncbi:hypothetical protein HBN50_03465 [Halobacteriovorax sp. GB3]|uniref:hypothetical protein n=1 Tax=Halobacteriovorax sp. GB3 TaxID=2719615 RepID=UPI0023600B54|nr:hypothetical protein [Halobacteriovorax sp. GB3]MDD0852136.1 hypothetical protein [Halobacteriovorax sp. GB3]
MKFSTSILFLLLCMQSFADFNCRETFIESNQLNEMRTVCFSSDKVCTYFNFHNTAPTLTYDCWSSSKSDPHASKRIGCSNSESGWPDCADGFIID